MARKPFIFLLLALWLSFASSCCAMTQEQSERLTQHLTALQSNNAELRTLLAELNRELLTAGEHSEALNSQIAILQQQSSKQGEQIALLKNQLVTLSGQSQELRQSLQIANAELMNAKKSFQATEKSLKREKTKNKILSILAAALSAVLIGKSM